MKSTRKEAVLVVDDEQGVHQALQEVLADDYRLLSAMNGESGLETLKAETVDIIILDLTMPGMSGFEFLRRLNEQDIRPDVIVVTASNHIDDAVQAMKLGAADYIVKPWNVDDLRMSVRRVADGRAMKRRLTWYETEDRATTPFGEIVTRSPAMADVLEMTRQMCQSDARVMITGETGTGKELIARAIHGNGLRKDGPLIVVNCAAIPGELLESELFGCERGAFTDAVRDRRGKFELADGGTIFLDEVSSLPLEMQGKLLRVIEDGVIDRLGSEKIRRVDVRILSACSSDLKTLVIDQGGGRGKSGIFREDLYYRLNVVPIHIPPLRDRREDIILLANHFRERFNRRCAKQIPGFTRHTTAIMREYRWPGNVRELENLVERLVVLGENHRRISHHQLPLEMLVARHEGRAPRRKGKGDLNFYVAVDEFEKNYLLQILEKSGWNQVTAARTLNVHRNTIIKKIIEFKLSKYVKQRRATHRKER